MLSFDASIIIVFLLVWILLAVLIKIFFNPLQKTMGDREAKINHNREAAQKAVESYEQTISKIDESIKVTKANAFSTQERFEREALKEKERMIAEISKECKSKVKETKEGLEKQMESLKKELESRSRLLAEEIEQRLLK